MQRCLPLIARNFNKSGIVLLAAFPTALKIEERQQRGVIVVETMNFVTKSYF